MGRCIGRSGVLKDYMSYDMRALVVLSTGKNGRFRRERSIESGGG